MFRMNFARLCRYAAVAMLGLGFTGVDAQPQQVEMMVGDAIAAQGNQALRDMRSEALASLRRLKPAPLEFFMMEARDNLVCDQKSGAV